MIVNCLVIISLNCDELYVFKCNVKGKKSMENKRKLVVKN